MRQMSLLCACVLGWGLYGSPSIQAADAPATQPVTPSADAWHLGWPMMTGPTGNLLPLRTDTPLVDDLSHARLLWVSATRNFGSAKTGSQTWANSQRVESFLGPDAKDFKGNWAGVVVADGRVFASSWVPSGKVFTAPYKTNRPYEKGDTPKVPTRFRVEADDIVICLDANNGKLLWQATEPGGLIRAGGKRGGFQVAMALAEGRAFALGSTGRLFAYETATGKKLWQSDIGPAFQAAVKEREEALATAAGGTVVIPDAPGWFTSLVVADGVLVSSNFRGTSDVGLSGYETATGKRLWEVPAIISKYATPSLWRHGDKTWLLTATDAGSLQLIDPLTGKNAWKVTGLGKNWNTLCPSANTVMVNVKPNVDKRTPGFWGAYRITPTGAEPAWKMPDEPRNEISTWMDDGAQQQAFIKDGRVFLHTGTKDVRGRILLLSERDGTILAEAPNGGSELNSVKGLILWLGDRAFVRANHSHGASHGGRHPLVAWQTEPGHLRPLQDEKRPGGLDLVNFDTAYEVLMQIPLVDGRIFERTDDGQLACYDLRQAKGAQVWPIGLEGGYVGLTGPLQVRIVATPEQVVSAKAWIADDQEAGIIYGKVRQRPTWENAEAVTLHIAGNRITGTLGVNFGTHKWPVELDLSKQDTIITGTWKRHIPALPEIKNSQGTLIGQVNDVRGLPTPWLADQPWTPLGKNPPGTRTVVLSLDGAIPLRGEPRGLTLSFDHDGKSFTRAGGYAFNFSQAWHEVDASGLTLKDNHITGSVRVVLNTDTYLGAPDVEQSRRFDGAAGAVTLDVKINTDNSLTGTYQVKWGEALDLSGKIVPASQP